MKYAVIIGFLPIYFFLPENVFGQTESGHIAHIKAYKASIDSLYGFYSSISRSLDENSMKLYYKSGLGEGIAEGVYKSQEDGNSKVEGGFSVYPFSKKDTIYRIYYEGGKKDAYVTKAFYYKNDSLVYSEMTVRPWAEQTNDPYKVIEYYWQNKRIAQETKNVFPAIKDKSLIPVALFEEGVNYLDIYRNKPPGR